MPGLTVVIGARGAGKTSLVELVRFCLGADSFTDEARNRGHQQALSVLAEGQVTVTLSNGSDHSTVARSAIDPSPRSTSDIPEVTILAQNEIEAVGAQSRGRLHLIDRLIPRRTDFDRSDTRLRAEIKSITLEIRDLLIEVDSMEENAADFGDVSEELAAALELEASALESVKATEAERAQLAELQSASSQTKVQQGVYERALDELRSMETALGTIAQRSALAEKWPESAGSEDRLSPMRERIAEVQHHLANAQRVLAEITQGIGVNVSRSVEQAIETDQASREIRRRLDAMEEGAGATTRKVAELREKAGQLSALRERLSETRSNAVLCGRRRDELYRSLDNLRQERFEARCSLAEELTDELGPSIQVAASRSEQTRPYADAIISGLRGSGLHYNTLGPEIAISLSPLELMQAVESREPQVIADAVGISRRRASTVIEALKSSDLASIIAAPIDDGITLELLDGAMFKSSENVSIGQRCTTVLPVLLAKHGGILLVDQPEDHLDNSFIANTVVTALQQRHTEDQLILASHNANIPVLGDADQVVILDSDGKRGFVRHAGSLDDKQSIQGITDIMEGGADAFAKRARFYGAGSDQD